MRILLLSSSYNSLTQRAQVELNDLGYDTQVVLAISESEIRQAIRGFSPDFILCPMLKFILPDDIWQKHTCIIIHPGIRGDRGASSLDWAILQQKTHWGVTAVQAAPEVDSGPIWASSEFTMRQGSKSSIYRDELAACAMRVIHLVVKRFKNKHFVPEPLDYSKTDVKGQYRPILKIHNRAINWQVDTAEQVIRKVRSADSNPGLLELSFGEPLYLYGAHREGKLIGAPGKIIAKRHGAICVATVDGAVWISHLKRKSGNPHEFFKLPATMVLGEELENVPEAPIPTPYTESVQTYKEIWCRELNGVAYLYFEFYNGAMSTEQCKRLNQAFTEVSCRPDVKVIVLMGGRDFWSNGIHLNFIEAADDPALESWRNINAMDDLVLNILSNTHQYVISAMHGNAGAGGVMLALAADKVIAKDGLVLNPHYQSMGGLYGSEYWTYLLPKRVGHQQALELTQACKPISAEQSSRIGLIDDIIYPDELSSSSFHEQIIRIAENVMHSDALPELLNNKQQQLSNDDNLKPLSEYREAELAQMHENFYGEDQSYHIARSHFVRKITTANTAAPTPIIPGKSRQNGAAPVSC